MTAKTPSQRGRSNRANGLRYQSDVARWLREHGFPGAESAGRQGWRTDGHVSADPYDLDGVPGVLWSLKRSERAATDAGALAYLTEVHDAATARGLLGVLVVKRPGSSDFGKSWAYRHVEIAGLEVPVRMTLEDLAAVLRAEGYGEAYVPGEAGEPIEASAS